MAAKRRTLAARFAPKTLTSRRVRTEYISAAGHVPRRRPKGDLHYPLETPNAFHMINDTPDSTPLAPLIQQTDFEDVMSRPLYLSGSDRRPGIYGSGAVEQDRLPSVAGAVGDGVRRRC